MNKCSRAKLLTLSTAIVVLGMFMANVALGQAYEVGGQVCVAANFEQSKTLENDPSGALNGNTEEARWLICPLVSDSDAVEVNASYRIRNDSTVTADLQCVYRVVNELGVIERSIPIPPTPASVLPGQTLILVTANFPTDFGDTVTVQCKLPPLFRIISMVVNSQ